MTMKEDFASPSERGESSAASRSQDTNRNTQSADQEAPLAKPPILWMLVPLILVGLAVYLAR
jgi:hypothetical protein